MSGDTGGRHSWGSGVTGTWWARTRDAETSFHTQDSPENQEVFTTEDNLLEVSV